MVSKIYESIKHIIKDNYKYIIAWILIYLFFTIPTNSYVIIGGGTIDINNRVEIEDSYKQEGSLNFSYVEEIRGTIATYLLSLIVPKYENESINNYKYSNETYDELLFREKLDLDKANNDAVFLAYTKARRNIEVLKPDIYISFIDDDKKVDTDLKVGDKLLKVDDFAIDSIDDYKNYINSKQEGDIVFIRVIDKVGKKKKRFAKVFMNENNLYTGIGVCEIDNFKLDPNLKFKFESNESGPSGGLMLTLQIYNKLIPEDITKGRNIVGTGTIDKDGTIGAIGGVKYKLQGAIKNKADIFICPKDNLKEALKEKKKK